MAKEFLRFLRGELNGFYITQINSSLNKFVQDVKEFVLEFNTQQFNPTMNSTTLFNLGKFAGIFLPRLSSSESRTGFRLSDSNIVDGVEYSERGLFNTDTETFEYKHRGLFNIDTETFEYKHTNQNPDLPDINTLSTEKLRSSLIGDESVKGYISANETDVLDDSGLVRPEKVLARPPEGEAYNNFHGNNFMFLADVITTYENLSPSLYYDLFVVLQWIRYNGASVESLCTVIKTLCPNGLVLINRIEVSADETRLIVYYKYNENADVNLKAQRIYLLQYIVDIKFLSVVLTEE